MRNPQAALTVRPKKRLGQHFLTDQATARRIVDLLVPEQSEQILEIGPGRGVLTRYLLADYPSRVIQAVEFDTEAVTYLHAEYGSTALEVIQADFLQYPLAAQPYALIGNLPYNISSPIFFKLLEHHTQVREAVFMIQKEVAERIAAPPGSKTYGILSVLLGYYYQIEYVLSVGPGAFYPPPKVQSAVLRLTRRKGIAPLDFKAFKLVVKTAFGQRRKTLHNALKPLGFDLPATIAGSRAEQLTVAQFVALTDLYLKSKNCN